MSVLVDRDIDAAMSTGSIVIEPFDPESLGTNSYDVHLADKLVVYDDIVLDVRAKDPRTRTMHIHPTNGFLLRPGELYLASTVEYTESREHLPILNGKSSLGRLGLSIHVTAGTGDVGFRGHWTMELFVIRPLRVYAGMAIGQLLWFTANPPRVPYDHKRSAKYGGRDPDPQASLMYREHVLVESED